MEYRTSRAGRLGYQWIAIFIGALALLGGLPAAQALPSYARQTGQQCAACHNGFPELTPYGRLFKLNGYTFLGGDSDWPALAAMGQAGFTNTNKSQPGGAGPHISPNDNVAFQAGSIFYGGAIAPSLGLGTFAQATYDNIHRRFTWDNTDIRWAKSTTLGGETVFGLSLNNNPSVTDLWNSTPAWRYPFITSGVGPAGPVPTATMIEGAFAQQVVGLNAYAFWNRLVYAEVGGYHTLPKAGDAAVGINPTGTTSINGIAPYWRFALQPQWGPSSFEIGTFGMAASLNPGRVTGSGTDHTTDIGFDTQYQFLSDVHSVSLQASYITENQNYTASQALGGTSNGRDFLRSFNVKSSYYYEQTYGGTLGYFSTRGSIDPLLYGTNSPTYNTPNTAGWIGELDYMPFNHGGPGFWPWLNMKVGVQYIYYQRFEGGSTNFDGAGRNASDNNTLFLFDWIAF
ncbi:MAG TPA: hypothetical protein VNF99_15575 [Stellaceae bacterium]|nr:hypothetical protein [Stellaceae bacterium]